MCPIKLYSVVFSGQCNPNSDTEFCCSKVPISIYDYNGFFSLVLFKMTTLFSGATVGVMKNTVAAQIVSTMPVEELKVKFRQKV